MPKRWSALGHQITLLTAVYDKSDLKKGQGLVDSLTIDGINIIRANIQISNRHSSAKRVLHFLTFSGIACWMALTKAYDIILTSSGPISVGLPGIIGWMRKRKFVFEVRDLWPTGSIELGLIKNKLLIKALYGFERLLYQKSNLLIVCSIGMKEHINRRFASVNTKVVVIPNGADLNLFKPRTQSLNNSVSLFVYTGSIGLMDDCMQLIYAAMELSRRGRKDIILRIIGEGSELSQLRFAAADLSNVEFAGLLPKTEVARHLEKAIGSIITFKPIAVLDTSSPNKLFDSLAAGVPIIHTTRGWIRDLVEVNDIGFSVNPNSAREMADKMEQLTDDLSLQRMMAKNARKVAEAHFDRETLSRHYLQEMENLVYST